MPIYDSDREYKDSSSGLRSSDDFKIEETVTTSTGTVPGDTPEHQRTDDDTGLEKETSSNIHISLTEDDLTGQVDVLQEETGASEGVAEKLYEAFQLMVIEEAEKQDKEWSDEVIDAVTNLVIATAIREEKQRELLS